MDKKLHIAGFAGATTIHSYEKYRVAGGTGMGKPIAIVSQSVADVSPIF
jgi:hypothetical protein